MIFTVTFVAEPGVDAIKSFRMLLKAALRHYGLRAIDVREHERARVCPSPCSSTRELTMSAFSERVRSQQHGFLKVSDIDRDTPWTLTITSLEEQVEVFSETKDVLHFKETGKQLALNQTTAEWLIINLGDNPQNWKGKQVVLHLAEYKYEGETKLGIRLRLPNATSPQRKPPMSNAPTRSSAAGNGGKADPDDAIPF
jgi:hypothetical protein